LIEKYAAADTLLEYLEEIMKKYKERQQAHHFSE
jgi:ribosome-associated translation inhibitor RaiA